MPQDDLVPKRDTILNWIERIFLPGIRRPGYPADREAESFCAEEFRRLGLTRVRLEPVSCPYWKPRSARLRVTGADEAFDLECFALPHSEPTGHLEGDLCAFDAQKPETIAGRVALCGVALMRLPPDFPALGLGPIPGGGRPGGWVHDPAGTFAGAQQVLPFGPQIQAVMEPAIDAGAIAFVGTLDRYPGDSLEYYVPYDGVARPMPGVWIRGSDGRRLRSLLARGPAHVEIEVDADRGIVRCHNVVGELPGADDELLVIGSHHDGPWSSAVEDASGVGLVMAQAAYWSRVPRESRPHRMIFLLDAGHMAGAAGCRGFLETHAAELDRIVLETHLEHAALEIVERDGRLEPSGRPETRWFFTSRIPALEAAVRDAVVAEKLERSIVLAPDAIGPHPTTDGGLFHLHGVPLVNFLSAPFYLFDPIDTLDKVDRAGLVPITRAAIRILKSTRGVSAAGMRAAVAYD